MIRFAVVICLLAGLVYLGAFYRLGSKPLAGHLGDIYRSPVVQEKIHELGAGVHHTAAVLGREAAGKLKTVKQSLGDRGEGTARSTEPTRERADAEGVHYASEREDLTKSIHRSTNPPPGKPAQDKLTDEDRLGLNHLVAEKTRERTHK